MQTLLAPATPRERPSGVLALAFIFFLIAATSLLYAALIAFGRASFVAAQWLVPADIAQAGPIAFAVYAAAHAAAAIGLLRRARWGRVAALAILAVGIYFAVPTVSAAVISGNILALVREGAAMIARVAFVWYLSQESTREAFTRR